MSVLAYIALGSNLNDPARQIEFAFEALSRLTDTRLLDTSSLYRSAPLGYTDQPDFINAVARVETRLTARQLLDALLDIEQRHGRVREFPNAPRTLDLDLLTYGGLIFHEHGLTLPHPRMHERAFVLRPLLEIDPEYRIPGRGPARTHLANCADQTLEPLARKTVDAPQKREGVA